MSHLGHKATWQVVGAMSSIPPNADIHRRGLHVRLVPFSDVDAPPLQGPRMRLAGGPGELQKSLLAARVVQQSSIALQTMMTISFIPTRASAVIPLLLDYSSSGKE
jgi:hypothetical protein